MLPPEELITSPDFSTFLKSWIAYKFPKSSLQSIATKCGLSSKGTLHDVLSGRRYPSLKLAHQLAKGIKLGGPERRLFFKLWELGDEATTPFGKKETAPFREKIRLAQSKKASNRLPSIKGWDLVYSALGTLQNGILLEELPRRCGIPINRCKKILTQLLELDLIEHDLDSNTWKAKALHSLFEAHSQEEKTYLQDKLNVLRSSLNENFGRTDKAIYRNFVFSVALHDFPKLRERLKRILDDFADTAENSTGEGLAEMFLSFELKSNRLPVDRGKP